MTGDESDKLAQALHESEACYRAVLETAVSPIIVMGEDRLIRLVNSAAVNLFGYASDEMVGQNVELLMPSPYREQHDGYVENYTRTGDRKIIGTGREVSAQRKDGSTFPIHLSVGEADLPSGKLFTAVILDLSEQKRLEEKLLNSSEDLQRRIGQDIHDDLCQQLTSIACLLKVLRQDSKQPNENSDTWELVEKMIHETNARARSVARGLVPIVLENEGLVAALSELAARKTELFQVDCHLVAADGVGAEISDKQILIHLFRIAQEAVRNAVNHGEATTIELHLTQSENELLLTISDDGTGIGDEPENSDGGMGLITMAQRARMISGELRVGDRDGGGTMVECKIPLR